MSPPAFDTAPLARDFTSAGTKLEAAYENDRNSVYSDLFKDIIREVFGVKDVICGHHLTYQISETRDGSVYTFVEEIPSADALIFDHKVARKLFGPAFRDQLMALVCEPIETRDRLLAKLYYGRKEPKNG